MFRWTSIPEGLTFLLRAPGALPADEGTGRAPPLVADRAGIGRREARYGNPTPPTSGIRKPDAPRSGWLDELDRLRGGWSWV